MGPGPALFAQQLRLGRPGCACTFLGALLGWSSWQGGRELGKRAEKAQKVNQQQSTCSCLVCFPQSIHFSWVGLAGVGLLRLCFMSYWKESFPYDL